MIRLSIVIPMYNVAPYVERCIRSLEEQDIARNTYEIICINDGSPDDCKGVVSKLQKEFGNIVLIDQENQGVSRARNNGINKACGKYLLFIDPDDYVDTNSFGRILNKVDRKKAQVSFLGFTFLRIDESVYKQILFADYQTMVYEGTETYFLSRGEGQVDPDRMVAVLFESEFINQNNLRYLQDVPYLEDGELIARILCLAERCIFDGHSFYQRTTRPGSATNSSLYNSKRATKGFLLSAASLKQFRTEQKLTEEQREFLNHPILKFVLLALDSSVNYGNLKILTDTVNELKKLGFRKVKRKGCKGNYRIHGIAYNISPYLGAFTQNVEPKVEKLFRMFSRR